jgi:hypothetical protein
MPDAAPVRTMTCDLPFDIVVYRHLGGCDCINWAIAEAGREKVGLQKLKACYSYYEKVRGQSHA